MGSIIHRGGAKMLVLPFKAKKKCKLKHPKGDADMCGECLRLNNVDVYPEMKKKKKV